jgi:hypothetical protein
MQRPVVLILATTIGFPLQGLADDVPAATLAALPQRSEVEVHLKQSQAVTGVIATNEANVLSLSAATVRGTGDLPAGGWGKVDVPYGAISHVNVLRVPKQTFRGQDGVSFWRVFSVTAADRRASIRTRERGVQRGLVRDVSEEGFVLCGDVTCQKRERVRMADVAQAEVGVMGRLGRSIAWASIASAAAIVFASWLGYAMSV